jgi:hypothetical protein
MDFTGVIAKINLFSLFLWKFLCTLKLKKYPFSVKISYEHAAPPYMPLGHPREGKDLVFICPIARQTFLLYDPVMYFQMTT